VLAVTPLMDSDRSAVEQVVCGVIGEILPGLAPATIPAGKHLKELGADSVDRVEIVLTIMDRLGLDLPMSDFSTIPSVGDLIDFLCEAAKT
jgi:polyketide biosynthesis acyl carrier protein